MEMSSNPRAGREYSAAHLLNELCRMMKLKNDAQLALCLEVAPPLVSKLRHNKLPLGGAILIRMHEVSGLDVGELRRILGDRRARFRMRTVERFKNMPQE